ARRLRRPDRPGRPALRPRGRRAPRARGPRGLDLGHRPGHLAQPPRPVVAARGGPAGRPAADDPGLRRGGRRRGRAGGRGPRGRLRSRVEGGRDDGPQAVAALRAPPGDARRARRGAAAQRRAQARRAVLRGGGLPAHGVAHRLPDALHPGRPLPGGHGARPGRGRRRGHRGDRPGCRGRPARVGDEPVGGQARARARPRRRRRLRAGRAAARARRRGPGDGRRRHLEPFGQVAAAGRDARHLRGHERGRGARRAHPDLLPPALGRRLDDGHPRRAGTARALLRRARDPPPDPRHDAAARRAGGLRRHGRGRPLRQGRLHRRRLL
ncbi:MAG: Alcohol dehydrogenase, partial [uncultured Solirubrobacteraceae bacterium]